MNYTQVELTSPDGILEVWWLPVPEGRAKVGEKITRKIVHTDVDWVISQVCVTLHEESIPTGSRIAKYFIREAQTIAYMSL